MKLRSIYLSVIILCLLAITPISSTANNGAGDYDWLKKRLAATKAFTVEVISAMPEDKYDFRPTKEVRTFKEQAYHVVYSIDYYKRVFGGNPRAAWAPGKEDSKSKAELIAWANEQFDEMEKVIMAASNNPRLTAGIISYLEHNSHHRGQMVAYLRKNGIAAPRYR